MTTEEIAAESGAGVDVEKDVLGLMGFKPLMPEVKTMDSRCFSK